jgi:hypothetical protein
VGPLVEAIVVFVGIPAVVLAVLAGLIYGAIAVANRLRTAEPVRLVAFPDRRTAAARMAARPNLRRVA